MKVLILVNQAASFPYNMDILFPVIALQSEGQEIIYYKGPSDLSQAMREVALYMELKSMGKEDLYVVFYGYSTTTVDLVTSPTQDWMIMTDEFRNDLIEKGMGVAINEYVIKPIDNVVRISDRGRKTVLALGTALSMAGIHKPIKPALYRDAFDPQFMPSMVDTEITKLSARYLINEVDLIIEMHGDIHLPDLAHRLSNSLLSESRWLVPSLEALNAAFIASSQIRVHYVKGSGLKSDQSIRFVPFIRNVDKVLPYMRTGVAIAKRDKSLLLVPYSDSTSLKGLDDLTTIYLKSGDTRHIRNGNARYEDMFNVIAKYLYIKDTGGGHPLFKDGRFHYEARSLSQVVLASFGTDALDRSVQYRFDNDYILTFSGMYLPLRRVDSQGSSEGTRRISFRAISPVVEDEPKPSVGKRLLQAFGLSK